ncbi:MAG: DegQ family serine endoprotease [Gammaproteobacteria bacterium]|jgi:serine protease Do/serine protease DegQ|nr:DegQ family serine endoprotease [Gammaproteobacteria bacterium]
MNNKFCAPLVAIMLIGFNSLAIGALPAMVDEQAVPTLAPLIEKVSPAVVNIAVMGQAGPTHPLCRDPFFSQFPQCQDREFQGGGSGVIVDADKGYILTNHHVVERADRIRITLLDKRTLEATVLGTDPLSDIAVLKVEPKDLHELPIADSSAARVGDFVVAIGNPFGLQHTVTSGIVSALGRSGLNAENYEDFIQTDAAINMGNSGGALINLKGELLGINSAIISNSGGSVGIGFAIPSNMARNVMNQILEHGEVRRGLLGVSVQSIDPDLAENLGLETTGGALVSQVMPDSAAERAGIEPGDVVLAIDGETITDAASLRLRVGMHGAGESVKILLLRDGEKMTVKASLGEASAGPVSAQDMHPGLEGASFQTVNTSSPDYDGVPGVLVSDVEQGSPAFANGLRSNDLILRVNRQRVGSTEELADAAREASSLLLQLRRGERSIVLVVR